MNYIQKKLKKTNFISYMRSIFIVFYFIYCRIVILGNTCDFCNCNCCKDCFKGDEKLVKEGNSEKINEEEEDLDIFALDTVTDKKYLIQVSENTKAARLKEKLIKILNTTNFEIRFRDNLYEGNQILKFEDGDTVYIYPKEEKKLSDLLQNKFMGEYKTLYDFYNDHKKSFFVIDYEGDLEEAKKKMKKKTEEFIKKFFDNIELIRKEELNVYKGNKILATFFLSDEDYDEYINECVEEENKHWEKTIVNGSNFNKILKENENFKKALEKYILTKGLNSDPKKHQKEIEEISINLSKCKPYEGLTYRGTRLYDENRDPIKINDNLEKKQPINVFIEKIKTGILEIEKIKTGILEMESIASFSSDMGVAGHFAAFIKNAKEAFNFVICNHINKTGVNIYEDYDKNIFERGLPEEKEILYPKGSKFKILGIHIKTLKTFGEKDIPASKMTLVNGAEANVDTEELKFDYPFIVIDVVQIE